MKYVFAGVCLLLTSTLVSQKSSLTEILWERASFCYGQLEYNSDHDDNWKEGDAIEIIDDAANGYLKVSGSYPTCGCYCETTVGAYKAADGDYTLLEMSWDGCGWRKTLSSNKVLNTVLPEGFGLGTFLPKSDSTEYQITSSVFFLEAEIPRKGTDTQINLSYIPFGINMHPDDPVLSYGYELVDEHDGANYLYQGELQATLRKVSDESTLECIIEKATENISARDKELVEKLYGEGKKYHDIDELAAQLQQLKTMYQISKDMEYKSVLLSWNREEARFAIKEKIKNEAPKLSFLEFIKQLPFLMAVC